jgi:protein SCO1
MRISHRRILIAVGLLMAGLAFGLGLYLSNVTNSPSVLPDKVQQYGAFLYPQPRDLDDFSLLDHAGNSFDKTRLEGRWSFVFMGFTRCPDVCPTTMATLGQFAELMEDSPYRADTQVVLVSLDPDYDTPERLGTYVSHFNPGFVGVTGDSKGLHDFARQLHVAHETGRDHGMDHADMMHSGQIALLDPEGRFAGFFKPPVNAENLWLAYQAVRS